MSGNKCKSGRAEMNLKITQTVTQSVSDGDDKLT